MATIRKEMRLSAPLEMVWDALADFQHVHTRLAPGFVVDSKPDGDTARVITFSNGSVVKETWSHVTRTTTGSPTSCRAIVSSITMRRRKSLPTDLGAAASSGRPTFCRTSSRPISMHRCKKAPRR